MLPQKYKTTSGHGKENDEQTNTKNTNTHVATYTYLQSKKKLNKQFIIYLLIVKFSIVQYLNHD